VCANNGTFAMCTISPPASSNTNGDNGKSALAPVGVIIAVVLVVTLMALLAAVLLYRRRQASQKAVFDFSFHTEVEHAGMTDNPLYLFAKHNSLVKPFDGLAHNIARQGIAASEIFSAYAIPMENTSPNMYEVCSCDIGSSPVYVVEIENGNLYEVPVVSKSASENSLVESGSRSAPERERSWVIGP
jgi:hypothetical protein